jgi:hypothetical protein
MNARKINEPSYMRKLQKIAGSDSFLMKVPSDGYAVVGPDTAKYWLENHNYQHQRALRGYHVEMLSGEMTAGRFREKTQVNFCRCGLSFYLTNGQHTLSAIVKSEQAILLSVVVQDCKSLDEVADNFSRHDTHLTRRLSDALNAHEIDVKLGVSKTELGWITAAAIYYCALIGEIPLKNRSQISHDEKMKIIDSYGILARDSMMAFHEINRKGFSFLTRKSTIACAMHVFMWDEDVCRRFYGEMSRDDGLKRGDPRKTLLEYLRMSRTIGGEVSGRSGKPTPDHMLVKAQSLAFNAYIQRRELQYLRPSIDGKKAVFEGPGDLSV